MSSRFLNQLVISAGSRQSTEQTIPTSKPIRNFVNVVVILVLAFLKLKIFCKQEHKNQEPGY
jgi:hypothetical protein